MKRRGRRAAAVLGVAALGGVLQAAPAGAGQSTKQYTFRHPSGQQVTCPFSFGTGDFRDEGGRFAANTTVDSSDPRCRAAVEVSLVYTDTYGNEQSVSSDGYQDVYLEASRVRGDITAIHKAFFTECDEDRSACWTGELYQPK